LQISTSEQNPTPPNEPGSAADFAAVAFFASMNSAYCRYEEAKLKAAFGGEYEQYAARVRRWI
jgi:protein-S-isoprenylcysteine O-methyltransferase Ste14